jgi:TfoX/Sxy family transcriptional regulator of competence genes
VAYDHGLADEVRAHLGPRADLTEREMFGGIAFMLRGNMAVGVSGDELMVRVGKEGHDVAISPPGARVFDMSSRPMKGWILVAAEALGTEDDLGSWVERGVAYAESLPPK